MVEASPFEAWMVMVYVFGSVGFTGWSFRISLSLEQAVSAANAIIRTVRVLNLVLHIFIIVSNYLIMGRRRGCPILYSVPWYYYLSNIIGYYHKQHQTHTHNHN